MRPKQPKGNPALLALLGCSVALLLFGCNPPELHGPLARGSGLIGEQNIALTLDGRNFAMNSRLVIDGNVDRGAGVSVAGPLTFVSEFQLQGALNIDANAPIGHHTIAVGDHFGISAYAADFFVTCAGCPPQPQLLNIKPVDPPHAQLYQGSQVTFRFYGLNLQNGNPQLGIEYDDGISYPHSGFTVFQDPLTGLDYFDALISAAPNAGTHYHDALVITTGGNSNSLRQLSVLAPGVLPPRITAVSVSPAACLVSGPNEITIKGDNLDPTSEIHIAYFYRGHPTDYIGEDNSFYQSRFGQFITTHLSYLSSSAASAFDVYAVGVNGFSNTFHADCSSADRPVLEQIFPAFVRAGTVVYVKCTGSNFGTGQVTVEEGKGVFLLELPFPVAADPDKVRVVKLAIAENAEPADVAIGIIVASGHTSNLQTLRVEPESSYDASLDSVSPASIQQGGDADVTVTGDRLASIISPLGGAYVSTPRGVDASDFHFESDYKSMTVHLHAYRFAPLSNDEDTNIGYGDVNSIAFTVLPSTGGPHIDSITPTTVTRSSYVWVRFDGTGFGSDPLVISSNTSKVPVVVNGLPGSDPDHVKVVELNIHSDAPATVDLQVQNTENNLISNPVIPSISIVDPEPNKPHVTSGGSLAVRRGHTYNNVEYLGENLQGVNAINSGTIYGLTFSNITPDNSGGASVSFTVTVAADATLSTEDATNLTVSGPNGTSNLFGINIEP
jgi:hypothetical protein